MILVIQTLSSYLATNKLILVVGKYGLWPNMSINKSHVTLFSLNNNYIK